MSPILEDIPKINASNTKKRMLNAYTKRIKRAVQESTTRIEAEAAKNERLLRESFVGIYRTMPMTNSAGVAKGPLISLAMSIGALGKSTYYEVVP